MRKWLVGVLLLIATVPGWCGQPVAYYRNDRQTLQAGVYVLPGTPAPLPATLNRFFATLDTLPVPVTYTAADPDFAFQFYPPHQPGWEFRNPLMADKSAADYWLIPVNEGPEIAHILANYDVILMPVLGSLVMPNYLRQAFTSWVHEGGLLWIDHMAPGQVENLLDPTPVVAATVATHIVAVDPTSVLLNRPYRLLPRDLARLGCQQPYASDPSGLAGGQATFTAGIAPARADGQPSLLQAVVMGDSNPMVAAGRYGRGAIIASACDMVDAVGAWLEGYAGGGAAADNQLPEWSLPDLKFACNAIAWWLGPRGNAGEAASLPANAPAPPPTAATLPIPDPTLTPTASGGPQRAAVQDGIAYFGDHDGNLYAMDVTPNADRDGDGRADDGLTDLATGATGDMIWEYTLPAGFLVTGSPAVGTVFDPLTGFPRTMLAFCAATADGSQSYLDAVWADFAVRHIQPAHATSPGLERSGGTVTVRTIEPHRLQPGDTVEVAGAADAGYNGVFVVTTVPDPNTFTYDQVAAGDPSGGGVVIPKLQPVNGYPFAIRLPAFPERINGQAQAGPFFANGMLFVITRDTSTNFNLPARDSHLLALDPVNPAAWAVHLELSQSGAVMSTANPPAMGLVTVSDAVTHQDVNAETLVWSGNALPRTTVSATGRLWMTPAMVRLVLPGWDGRWLKNPTQPDTAANQAVQIRLHGTDLLTPHLDDDPARPLQYVRQTAGGQVEIIFPRWTFFQDHPTTWEDTFQVTYTDNTGTERNVTATLSMGVASPLNMAVSDEPGAGPAVVGNTAYVCGNAVNGYPGASFYGGVAALDKRITGNPQIKWQFYGIKRDAANANNLFYSFPYTPTVSGNFVFAAGNLAFTQPANGAGPTAVPPDGAQGVLYCLDTNCSDELRLADGSPVLEATGFDYQAPKGQSADRTANIDPNRRGVPVYLEVAGGEPIPARMGSTNNWWVDYEHGVVHVNLQTVGRYYYSLDNQANFVYFKGGVRTPVTVFLPRLVVWQYLFPSATRLVGPPVASGNYLYVLTQTNDTGEVRLHAFEQTPRVATIVAREVEHAPVWSVSLGARNQLTAPATMALAGDHLVVCLDAAEGPGVVISLGQEHTVIADNNRLLDVDGDNRAAWCGLATATPSPRNTTDNRLTLPAVPGSGVPESAAYAYRVNSGFSRPSRVRVLPEGDLLVCDTGNNRVVQMGSDGEIVWQYPDSDPDDLTPTEMRLLSPTDVQRYVATTSEAIAGVGHVVRWESTLIADMGNCRVLEVVRPLVDGVYQPALGPRFRQRAQVLAGPDTLGGATPIGRWMFTTASRYGPQDTQYPMWSSTLLCAVANNPANRGGTTQPLGLVKVIVTYALDADNNPVVDTSTVPAGAEGFNQTVRNRTGADGRALDDFIDIRQADVLDSSTDPRVMVVDRQGVKVIRLSTWESGGPLASPAGGVWEMTAADYQADMVTLKAELDTYVAPSYPPCIRDDDPAAAFAKAQLYATDAVTAGNAGQVYFHPAYAQLLPDGTLLVVNTFGAPYDVSDPDNPLEVAGPTRSEVLQYDPAQAQGRRIFDVGAYGSPSLRQHFVVPDPFRASYPLVTGTSAGLKQPLAVERR